MIPTENETATVSSSPERLLAEFAPADYDAWKQVVEVELKGAPFDKKMLTPTYEGITLQPIYSRADGEKVAQRHDRSGISPFLRGSTTAGYIGKPWDVSQEIAFPSAAQFNHTARNYLDRGLNALHMVLDKASRRSIDPDWAKPGEVGVGGLSIASAADLERALDGIDLNKVSLFIRTGASGMPMAALLAGLAKKRKKNLKKLRGCIEIDPLGVLAHEGALPQSLNAAYREMAALTRWAEKSAPNLQTICVHSRSWHEAGGSAVQELAFVIATALDYLRAMSSHDLPVETVAPRIRFAMTVGENFFMEIAKLRALRLLWSRLVGALGASESAQKLSLHVRTCRWNKTVFDPYVNMLRATVEAFTGVLGGCDSMQVIAFDEIARRPDDFSQRIARNTQLILREECELLNVIDPAGGSWYVETLTQELARRAWALFQEIEKKGGMAAAMREGFPQQMVGETAAEKLKNVARRRDVIVGINQYANVKEQRLEKPADDTEEFRKRRVQEISASRNAFDDTQNTDVLKCLAKIVDLKKADLFKACVDAAVAGATLGEITRAVRINDRLDQPITPVCLTRAAVQYEELRESMDTHAARTGARAKVFLANMGPLRQHKARADFSRGFFEAGGFDVISPAGFKTPDEAAQAFADSGALLVVLCSTDDTYLELVPQLTQAIRAKKPDAIVVLAGYPLEHIEAFKQAGVNEFIHMRANALEVLEELQGKLGIHS